MGGAASGDPVGEHLESLEAAFGPFDVDQTTIAVAPTVFERARERAERGLLDAVVRVWNEDGDVLQVADDEGWTLPRRRSLSVDALAETVERTIATEFDVECTFDGVERVTIAGVHNRAEQETDTVYRLFTVVDASHAGGQPCEGEWRSIDPHRVLVQTV